MSDIAERWERMAQFARKREADFLAWIATQPQSVQCEVHPSATRLLDLELSKTATSDYRRDIVRYVPCQICAEAKADERERERLHGMGVPSNLIHASFENWQSDDEVGKTNIATARDFCRVRRGFLVLLGDFGTGKSHIATACLREWRSGLFKKQSTLLYELRETYRDRKAEDPKDSAMRAGLLVIDELGLSPGGRDEFPQLHEILDYRHCEKLPVILTGNVTRDELKGVIGERLADRLRESAFAVLTFQGKSSRSRCRERYFDTNA